MALSDHGFPSASVATGNVGPFEASDGDLFIIGHGGTTQVEVLRSADNGATWGTPVASTAGRNVSVIDADQSGDTLYVVWSTVTYASGKDTLFDVEYREFNMATNSWSGSVDIVDSPDVTDDGVTGGGHVAVARRTSDSVILYQGDEHADMGNGFASVVYARGTAGSWGTVNVAVAANTGGTGWRPLGAIVGSVAGDCHLIYTDESTTFAKTLRAANTLSTEVEIDTAATPLAHIGQSLVTWDDAGTQRIGYTYSGSTSICYFVRPRENATTDDIEADQARVDISTTTGGTSQFGFVAVDTDNDEVYVFFPGTDADLFYTNSTNGASGDWNTDIEAEDAVTIAAKGGAFFDSGRSIIGYIADDSAGSGNTIYGELSLGAGSLTVDPTLVSQLISGTGPQLNMQIVPALESQLVAGIDPSVAALLTPTLVSQLLTGTDPTQLYRTLPTDLVTQLIAGVDPQANMTVTPALESQLVAGVDPQLNLRLTVALVSQILTASDPDVVNTQLLDPALVSQLIAGNSPQLNMQIVAALVTQSITASDPQLNLHLTFSLVSQLLAGVDPTVVGVQALDPALVSQLIAGVDPQVNMSIIAALESQLLAAVDPSVAFGITPAVVSQLLSGTDPSQLSMQIQAALESQLLAAAEPALAITIHAALVSQLLAGVDPAQLTMQIVPALISQLVAGIDPEVQLSGGGQAIDPALVSQLVAGLSPQLNLELLPAVVSQLLAATDPSVAFALSPVLVSQLIAGVDPTQLSMSIPTDLVSQLAAGVSPSFLMQLVPAVVSQLVAAIDPSVAFGITPQLFSQLLAANEPQLNMSILTAVVSQLLAGVDPNVTTIRVKFTEGALDVSVVDGRLSVSIVEGGVSASNPSEG